MASSTCAMMQRGCEDEIGKVDLFNDKGAHFYAYLYLSAATCAHLGLNDKAALDKINLDEKIRSFIGEHWYITDRPTMTTSVSFLSDEPILIYQS